MSVYVCSLIANDAQEIPPREYHLLRFPYGDAESYDPWNMHPARQPDGTVSSFSDERSGLIRPAVEGWGLLVANVHWEPGRYTELRDRFVRDPLGEPDSTGTDHRPPSPGMQCFTKTHAIFVRPDVPLGLKVFHNDSKPRRVVHAQFKLMVHADVATPAAAD